MENAAATLENGLAIPQMVKHRVTVWPSNSTWVCTQEKWKQCHTDTCTQHLGQHFSKQLRGGDNPKHWSMDEWVFFLSGIST